MELKQVFEVAQPPKLVWDAFGDLRATASCIPGAEITEVEDNRRALGRFKVRIGPIAAAFQGEAEVERDDATLSGVIAGSGRDGRSSSRVKSTVRYQLVEVDGGARTRVELAVDYTISGSLAQFSRGGIVQDVADRLTASFAENLEARLSAAAAPVEAGPEEKEGEAAPAATPAATPAAAPAPAPAQELDMGGLLLSVIWRRIAGFFARLFGRR